MHSWLWRGSLRLTYSSRTAHASKQAGSLIRLRTYSCLEKCGSTIASNNGAVMSAPAQHECMQAGSRMDSVEHTEETDS